MKPLLLDVGLLFQRIAMGGLMASHGLQKVLNYTAMTAVFPDPLGIGVKFTLIVAIFAELFCSLLVMVGLSTRYAVIPIICTLMTAVLIVHAADPWPKKEFALIYCIPFITLMLTGPGAFSVDGMIRMRNSIRP